MTDPQSFLTAIRRRPWDDGPRLMFADWLTERGDPRGMFLRAQCAAARLPRHAPERGAWEDQAADLLRVHQEEWLGPLAGVAADWKFRRGLLAWVEVRAEHFLASGSRWWDGFLGPWGIRFCEAVGRLGEVARCRHLRKVGGIALADTQLTHADLEDLLRSPHLRRLRHLNLHGYPDMAGRSDLFAGAPWPRLRRLLRGDPMPHEDVPRILAAWPGLAALRVLSLQWADISLAGLRTVVESPHASGLRALLLQGNELPGDALRFLAETPCLPHLRFLDYRQNVVDEAGLQALASSAHRTALRSLHLGMASGLCDAPVALLAGTDRLRLRELSVNDLDISDGGLRVLGRSRLVARVRHLQLGPEPPWGRTRWPDLLGSPRLRRLRTLSLMTVSVPRAGLRAFAAGPGTCHAFTSEGPFDDACIKALVHSPRLRDLTLLSLDTEEMTMEGYRMLFGRNQLRALRSLSLFGHLSLDSMRLLAQSPLLKSLRELHLGGLELEAECAAVLAASSHMTGLRSLSIAGHTFGDQATQSLAAGRYWDQLTHLDLSGCQIGADGAAALATAPWIGRLTWLKLSPGPLGERGFLALAEGTGFGPMLRVSLLGGGGAADRPSPAVQAALRRRFGERLSLSTDFSLQTPSPADTPGDDSADADP